MLLFQLTHAHVERDVWNKKTRSGSLHFNSHAHVERDYLCTMRCWELKSFQLTLTWALTVFTTLFVKQNIFQLTLIKSVITHMTSSCSLLEFQLTLTWAATRSIHNRQPLLNFNSRVGVTKRSRSGRRTDIHFNSRSRGA